MTFRHLTVASTISSVLNCSKLSTSSSTSLRKKKRFSLLKNMTHCFQVRSLRWIKEWICSERPITICAVVKGWTRQKFLIWLQRKVTMEQGPISALVSFTLQRNLWGCVKTWRSQGSQIWPKCDITRRQRPMRALVLFTLQKNLHTNMRKIRLLDYSPQSACSCWPAGFISTCFYSSEGFSVYNF